MQDKAEKRKRDDGDESDVRHAFQSAETFHSLKFILFPVPTFHNHIYTMYLILVSGYWESSSKTSLPSPSTAAH